MAGEASGTPIPIASGGGLVPLLTDVVVSKTMQAQFYCSTIMSEITTKQYNDQFKCLADEVIIVREPRGDNYKFCADGGALPKPKPYELTSTRMSIKRTRGIRESLSMLEEAMACRSKELMLRKLANDVKSLEQDIEREMFREMVAGAGPYNKGLSAGIHSRIYNLGAGGMPVAITAQNVLEVFTHVVGALAQECHGNMGKPFIVVPLEFRTILYNNPILANACASGLNQSSLVSGIIPKTMLDQVTLYYSKNLPVHQEVGGQRAFSMPFGYTDATAFFFKEIVNRTVEDPDSFDKYWDRLYAYDMHVTDERYLGVLYGTVTI